MAEIKVTTQAVTDAEVTRLFDMVFKNEWPVDAIRIAATVGGFRKIAEAAQALLLTYEPTWDGRSLREPEIAALRSALGADCRHGAMGWCSDCQAKYGPLEAG